MGWNDVDKRCADCGQVTEVARGFTKQNLKRLVFTKPTLQDVIVLIMLIMVLFIGWRYGIETEMCRNSLEDIETTCKAIETINDNSGTRPIGGMNITQVNNTLNLFDDD